MFSFKFTDVILKKTLSQIFLSSLKRARVSHRAVLGAYWSPWHEKALKPTIHAVVNGGSGDGEVASSIQMRFSAREESEEMPRSWRGGWRREAEASTLHAGLCSSVFLFREGSHKVLYTEFYPILSPGFPRSQGGYGIREAKGRFPHSRGSFIETNGLVRLFLLVPSSSLSCFTLLALRGLPVSVTLSLSRSFFLSLFLLALLSLTLECAFPPLPFRFSAALLSSLLPRVTPPANPPGLLIFRQRTLKAQPKASFE